MEEELVDISLRTVESSCPENDAPPVPNKSRPEKMFCATLCCYTSLTDDPMLCGRQKNDGFCINTRVCMDPSADSLGVGYLENKNANEICKVGGLCCTCALKKPQMKCTSVGQCLCVRSVQSFPFNPDYVKAPICACCFIQFFPTIGCIKDAPECPAHSSLVEVGGGILTSHSVVKDIIRSHQMKR